MTKEEPKREVHARELREKIRALCDRDGIVKLARRWGMNERTLSLASAGRAMNPGTQLQISEGLKREAP